MQRVSGLYRSRVEAEAASEKLVRRGLPPENLRILALGRAAAQPEPPARGDSGLPPAASDPAFSPANPSSQTLSRRVLGGTLGLFAGLLGTIALDPSNLGADIASPMLATLALLGGGAGLGGLVGGLTAAGPAAGADDAAARLRSSGHVVLVVQTRSAAQTSEARRIIGSAVIDRRGG